MWAQIHNLLYEIARSTQICYVPLLQKGEKGRAQNYMTEKVDWKGRTKEENRGFGFSTAGTRVAFMIHKHLHHHIERAMRGALEDANSAIAEGIQETVKMKLGHILKNLKVEAKTR